MSAASPSTPLAAIFGLAGPRLTDPERKFFERVRPLGFILFARNIENPTQVTELVRDLRALVPGQEALVLIDQEGGRVQRLRPPHWRFAPAAAEFGDLYGRNPEAARGALKLNMQLIGQELAELGIDVDCAPVLDVPVSGAHDVIGDRAFSTDPSVVASLGPVAGEGLIAAGVVPVIKHAPGHGRARADSHKELPVVEADLNALRASDFVPFAAFAATGMTAFAMTGHVVYAAIDPARPATTSAKVIGEIIRGALGFGGLLMSDDLGMRALSGGFDQRARESLAAGCDVVLHCDGNLADMEAVAAGCGPLGENGQRALAAVASVRRRPRSILSPAVAMVQVINALRHG